MPQNICQNCNKQFYTTRKKSKACTPKCRTKLFESQTGYYSKMRELDKKVYTKQCVSCQKEFTCNNNNYKACSSICSKNYNRDYNRTKYTRKNNKCMKCDTLLEKREQKYCSTCKKTVKINTCKTCGVRIKPRSKYCPSHKPVYKKVSYQKKCETCEREFTAKTKNSRFCKRNCRPSRKARKRLSSRKSARCKPDWMSWDEIIEFEKTKPFPSAHLDHIHPLNHPDLCGLHVPCNLQWLSPEDNIKKSNQFDGTYENFSWKKK